MLKQNFIDEVFTFRDLKMKTNIYLRNFFLDIKGIF